MSRNVWIVSVVVILLISLFIAAAALWNLQSGLHGYRESQQVYQDVIQEVQTPEVGDKISQKSSENILFLPFIDFDELETINSDVIGWLYCPDTAINYPVVQGGDNSFYLTHLIDGSEGSYGTLFMDCQSSLTDKNILIYGHHMRDGGMFASLLNYQNQEYYDTHPVMYFITRNRTYEVQLFAGFTTSPDGDAYCQNFVRRDDFLSWANAMREQSDFQTEVTPTEYDRVLTLSTCAYSFQDARYVVMGVLHNMIRS